MKKKTKIALIVVTVIVILVIIALGIVGNYFYNLALNPNSSKDLVLGSSELTEEQKQIREEKRKWLVEHSEDVYMTSEDKLKLHAYQVINENPSDIWVIAIHGYMNEGNGMISQAQKFYEMGYNVLIPDLRGHGTSEGNYIGMGWDDRLDIIQWANTIIAKNDNSKIILYGISMGGATVMMTTGETLPSNIKLAIEDCGYSSVWDEFAAQLEDLFKLPTFPVLDVANLVTMIRAGYEFKEASSVAQVAKSTTPTLFIHGDKDAFVPFSMLDKVYNAANCEKQKLVIEGAEHATSMDVNPTLYWDTITSFIQQHIA